MNALPLMRNLDLSPPRSVLAVPGTSTRFLTKALSTATDVIMIDWEDGTATADKATARDTTAIFLEEIAALTPAHTARHDASPRMWLRVNGPLTHEFARDACAYEEHIQPAAGLPIIIPMATIDAVRKAAVRLQSVPLIAMIETAAGLEEAALIAREPFVSGLMFGEYDYLATMASSGSVRMTDTSWAKARLVNAAATAGKWVIAGPNANFSDEEGLRAQAHREADLGFAGKLCIHPTQLDDVNAAFSPNADYISWAKELLEEIQQDLHPDGAFRFRGQMVDAPVIERARAAVEIARKTP